MRVLLVRHGQTVWNASNRAQGHTDIELNETGRVQAARLARRLTDMKVDVVLSSDLVRCRQTLAPFRALRPGLTVEERSDLRERTFGRMEGEDYSVLHEWMREEGLRTGKPEREVRPPGGESMDDVWIRLNAVEDRIRSEDRCVLVVSHGGALAQLIAKLIRGGHDAPRAFRFENCGLTELTRRPDGFYVISRLNDCKHLEAPVEVA
ncbi:MAG: histidine phosphatase family protein [Armatimonadetes bacterium]|nr:histidine phosphatase family protein [Armatimonadota bacterium]